MQFCSGRILTLLIYLNIFCGFCGTLSATENTEELYQSCLINFRISELLRLKSSLDKISDTQTNTVSKENIRPGNLTQTDEKCEGPTALALKGEERGYHPQPWQPEDKPSKLQTLFQITITALTFLSFGGYLLCLIVQAIKSKGTTYFHPVATATTTSANGGVKRIKIYRRGRRWIYGSNATTVEMNYGNI